MSKVRDEAHMCSAVQKTLHRQIASMCNAESLYGEDDIDPDYWAQPEVRLILEVVIRAWHEGGHESSRSFFLDEESVLPCYCKILLLDVDQVRVAYKTRNPAYLRSIANE